MASSLVDETIYLDHAATTPLDPAVLDAMLPYLGDRFGNPSSIYGLGQENKAAIDRARRDVASVLGCLPSELIFTGGATESDNLAITGIAWAARFANPAGPVPHIVTTAIEHSAVLETVRLLVRQGFSSTVVPCDEQGLVSAKALGEAIRPETCLVSVMFANNEVGSIQPIADIARVAHERGVPIHTDATQAPGSLDLNVDALGVDLLTLSGHKFYGPKGVGLLYLRKGVNLIAAQTGGGQEGGMRGGTENVAGIVGFATALTRAESMRDAYVSHCRSLRDRLVDGLIAAIPGVHLNGPATTGPRLPNNANLAFEGVQGESILLNLDMEGIAASAGSACTVGKSEPSHVLEAMGLSEAATRSSVRFTVGRSNTAEQIDEAIEIIAATVERVRSLGAVA
jgi:cysteine desulfurase